MVKKGKLALDSNIAILILNRDSSIIDLLKWIGTYYLPITVCGELLYGAENSARADENLPKYKAFIHKSKILEINLPIAREYVVVRKKLRKLGRPIPENDIWIAATCKVNKIGLATRDQHFSYVSGLKTVKV